MELAVLNNIYRHLTCDICQLIAMPDIHMLYPHAQYNDDLTRAKELAQALDTARTAGHLERLSIVEQALVQNNRAYLKREDADPTTALDKVLGEPDAGYMKVRLWGEEANDEAGEPSIDPTWNGTASCNGTGRTEEHTDEIRQSDDSGW